LGFENQNSFEMFDPVDPGPKLFSVLRGVKPVCELYLDIKRYVSMAVNYFFLVSFWANLCLWKQSLGKGQIRTHSFTQLIN